MSERQAGEAAVGSEELIAGVGAFGLVAAFVEEVVAVVADEQGVLDGGVAGSLVGVPGGEVVELAPGEAGVVAEFAPAV